MTLTNIPTLTLTTTEIEVLSNFYKMMDNDFGITIEDVWNVLTDIHEFATTKNCDNAIYIIKEEEN